MKLGALLLLLVTARISAADPCPPEVPSAKPLVVGTVPVPPFILKRTDGSWGGISMDLWREVASRAHLPYEVRELAAADLRDPAKLAGLDAFVSFNVTAEREAQFDLTHAFYSTGLAIAVAPTSDDGISATLGAIFTARFGKLVGGLLVVLLLTGTLMWLLERRHNQAQFGGSPVRGIGAGFWWSAVTMTTVGYGDKAPVTLLGRALALFWMFAAILVIASFTAAIASALTVNQLASSISGPADLPKVKVGTVEPSAGARYLAARRIGYHAYPDATAAIAGLAGGEVDAIVYEAPILQFRVRERGDAGLVVLDGTFDNHGYAFALATCSPHREAVNRALLEVIATDDWTAILARYLGT